MTKEEKKNKLNELDEALLNRMIELMKSGETNLLPELATVSNYLAKNNMVEEKERSSVDDEVKNRVAEARKRRESK